MTKTENVHLRMLRKPGKRKEKGGRVFEALTQTARRPGSRPPVFCTVVALCGPSRIKGISVFPVKGLAATN